MNIHWKDWCWSWNSNTLATWCEELTQRKRLWCWERQRAGGEEDDRGWDGWVAPPTQWTWVWANSRLQWRTDKPGSLPSMGSQRIRSDLATEQQKITEGSPCSQTEAFLERGQASGQALCSFKNKSPIGWSRNFCCFPFKQHMFQSAY